MKMWKSAMSLSVAVGTLLSFAPSDASAVTIEAGLTPMGTVTWDSLDDNTFDVGFTAFYAQLSPFVEQQAYRFAPTFSGTGAGTALDELLFVEITAYAGTNNLELCGSVSGCSTVFNGAAAPGSTNTSILSSTEDYKFKLNSLSGTWSSDAALNSDGLDHFVVFKVTTPGVVNITPTTLGGGAVVLNLLAGDLLIGVEDLPGGLPGSDRDFNDLFFHARSRAVPEPASMALLGLGLLGASRLRKRNEA
ncbi:MAG: DUF4114 domain-containing protein [Deltaproteobacteria bacterium]|nr:DUF4114 domain-containing protein [Deltaproteobacteria bacterium]